MSVSTLESDTICNMAYVRCMQAKLTLKVAGGAECRGRHDDLQLADQVLYGLIAGALTSSPGVHGDWDMAAALAPSLGVQTTRWKATRQTTRWKATRPTTRSRKIMRYQYRIND